MMEKSVKGIVAKTQLVAFMALLMTAVCLPATASLPIQSANVTPHVQNLVATLTDFGTEDFYAGALEGSIYSANPSVRVSTITHQIKPFAVAEGSYILAKAARRYPPGTVFVGEVDPGSDKDRRFIVLETLDGKLFVGPDNGLFTGVMDDLGLAHAYQITNRSLINPEQESATFRSFYISGPVAARLAAGVRPESVGPEIEDPVRLPTARPTINESMITGTIIHVDGYGNLLTNIPGNSAGEAGIEAGSPLKIRLGNHSFNATFAITYSDVARGEWLAMNSSEGLLQASTNLGNAAATADASAGEPISFFLRL
jgi:S-adenosyl-L-methionine hydrolase (adenosine-forming)